MYRPLAESMPPSSPLKMDLAGYPSTYLSLEVTPDAVDGLYFRTLL